LFSAAVGAANKATAQTNTPVKMEKIVFRLPGWFEDATGILGRQIHARTFMVRTAGLEPARLTALPPQSSVSANSTTCANGALINQTPARLQGHFPGCAALFARIICLQFAASRA
jgi:hypothetical protein